MPCWGNCDCNLCREEKLEFLNFLKNNGYSSVKEWDREFDIDRLDEFCFRYRPWLEIDEPSPRCLSKSLRKKRKAKRAQSASI